MERVAIIVIIVVLFSVTVKIQRLDANGLNDVFTFLEKEEKTDLERNVEELIESRGFICETHFVITEDGYNLTLHRIINPTKSGKVTTSKVVLLQHPLLGSSADFLINSEGGNINETTRLDGVIGNNLGFELSYQGYDVWLGNSRGNTYGRNHIFYKISDPEFWNFSFDEMIKYDLPFTINYIKRITNHSTIGYVGHSQGTLLMFGLLSTRPEFNDVIKPFIAMAPVSYVGNIKSPLKYIAKNPFLYEYFRWRGGSFLMNTELLKLFSNYCPWRVIKNLCESVTFLFCGPDSRQFNATRFPVYVAHTPSGTSTQNIVHFAQQINSKKFSFYDYGTQDNKIKYGSKSPPEYSLEKISNKYIAILSSQNDWLADPEDVKILRRKLKVKLIYDYVVEDKHWNHLDFIWAIDAGKVINTRVIKLLDKYIGL